MGLGAPLALLAMALVAGPILAHLVRRRDLQTRPLPTIALLDRAVARSRRRVRVADRLLLLLRLLAVGLLVIAATAPFLRSRQAFGDNQRATLVVILDDSMSVSRREDDTTLLRETQRRVAERVRSLPEGSEVAIVLGGSPARMLVSRTDQREAAARALLALPDASGRGTDLAGAAALARRALAGARHQRRLWVLSDFARHARAADVRWPTDGVQIALERLGPEQTPVNRAIVEATASPDPTRPGETSIRVRALGPDGSLNVALRGEDGVLGRGELTLQGGGGHLTFHVPSSEQLAAQVEIEGDDVLAEDDRRGVLLRPPAAVRVLLVDGSPGAARTQSEVGFLARALDAAPREEGPIRYRTLDADALTPAALGDTDVVVLANVPAPSPALASAIQRLVREGGGLWITAGSRVDARAYRSRFGDLLPGTLSAATRIEEPLRPVPEGSLWPDRGLDAAHASWALVVETRPGATVHARAGATPMLVTRSLGRGRIALWASTLSDEWTDLPYHPGFVALASATLRSLGRTTAAPQTLITAGQEVPLTRHEQLEVRLPSGERVVVDDSTFTQTERTGAYIMLDEGTPRSAFIVAAPAEESDLTTAGLPEVDGHPSEKAAGALSRIAIDRWFFLLAGLLLLGEGLLRERGRSRT